MTEMEIQLRAMALDIATKSGVQGDAVLVMAQKVYSFLKGETNE